MQDIRQIEIIIQELRARLHEIARKKSLSDPEVVKASQELDEMLIKYERFFKMRIDDD
ncbi:aspartyl-phosphate phosphatase Spo0E family protein [bacterium BFN5]|nr:aspartyl-phosphate phosphatase Spo0E family protein [bacterium BFN5]